MKRKSLTKKEIEFLSRPSIAEKIRARKLYKELRESGCSAWSNKKRRSK